MFGLRTAWKHGEVQPSHGRRYGARPHRWPTKGVMRAAGKSRVGKRVYRPILYSIVRGPLVGPSDDTAETCERPRSVTIVLTPEPLARATPDPPLGHQSAHKFEISR
jgi:hypothetical protein